jgi:hypothetical protein
MCDVCDVDFDQESLKADLGVLSFLLDFYQLNCRRLLHACWSKETRLHVVHQMCSKISDVWVLKVRTVGARAFNTCNQGFFRVDDGMRCLSLERTSSKVQEAFAHEGRVLCLTAWCSGHAYETAP